MITPAGVAAFARDVETSEQVWSAEIGYPGDPDYREFYRDLGYDGDYEYVKPYLHSDGVRRNLGIKYFRVTGKVDLGAKQPYVPSWATHKAALHAGNFMFNRQAQVRHLNPVLGRKPLIVSPYEIGGVTAGTIGVLGPTRMDYPQALAAVAVVSQRLSDRLTEG